jgi:VWFA-related protein
MSSRRCVPFILLFLVSSLYCQTANPNPSAPVPTFKAKVRVVVVNVVVTEGKDEPVSGLRKKDFEVFEDGKPQTVSTFEEHKGAPLTQIKLPPMPAGIYTNFPTVQASGSVNVLLLDALNTQTRDQTYLHTELLKYLKTIPPGTRVAIFTLSSRLRMIQPVTSDSSLLLAVLNDKKSGVWGAHPSALLPSEAEKEADTHAVDFMIQESQVPVTQSPDDPPTQAQQAISPIVAMQQFLADTAAFQTEARTRITLQSLQQLARYLSDIPGRKNIIWFSGSFPTGILPDPDPETSDPFSSVKELQQQVHETADILAANQVAIYPIGAEGLATDSRYEANAAEIGTKRGMQVTQDQLTEMRSEQGDRASTHASMELLAKDSGGEAYYDSNGLGNALLRVINNGARYYTISYATSNPKMDGKFRHVEVKVTEGKYKLAYRRGYYADDIESTEKNAQQQNSDPLYPLMGVNLPNFSQIVYKVRVLPSTPQPQPDAPFLGSNPAIKGPRTRYSADFAITLQDLKLTLAPDGRYHGNIEIMMVLYDPQGRPMNMVIKQAGLLLKPDVYKSMEKVGLQFKSDIDVPGGRALMLRVGVYDLESSKAGTLSIPLKDAPTTAALQKKQ